MNEVRELTEMEVEAVVGGGLFDGGGFNINIEPHINVVTSANVAIGGFAIALFGGTATAGGALAGTNFLH
jgi:hypothetical protein